MSSVEQSLTLPAEAPSSAHFSGVGRSLRRAFNRWAVVAGFLLLWEIVPRAHWVEPAFLPPFSEVMRTGWRLLANGQLAQHAAAMDRPVRDGRELPVHAMSLSDANRSAGGRKHPFDRRSSNGRLAERLCS